MAEGRSEYNARNKAIIGNNGQNGAKWGLLRRKMM
jgi:hypothetical protein